MKEEMTKACANLPAADVSGGIDQENNQDIDANMSFEGQDPSDYPELMGNEAAQ